MGKFARDPSLVWKILAMVLAVAVFVLCVLGAFFLESMEIVFAALGTGAAMCAVSGIMALIKGRRILGYLCSVLAGALLVLLLFWLLGANW